MRLVIFLVIAIVSGCATHPEKEEQEGPEKNWYNSALYSKYDSGELSGDELDHAFITAKNRCRIESLQIPIPSPSCSTIPAPNCSGLVGFSAGLCGSQRARQRCDYSSVEAAYAARSEVYDSCMNLDGWQYLTIKEINNDRFSITEEDRASLIKCLHSEGSTIAIITGKEEDKLAYSKKNIAFFVSKLDANDFDYSYRTCHNGAPEDIGSLLAIIQIVTGHAQK